MKAKIKAHLFTLPRWFAVPFFGASILIGSVLAGGLCGNAWIGLIAGLLVMAGGHSFNSFLDYSWTGLDKGEAEDRSAEKDYTGGQNLIENGIVSAREVAFNAIGWYLLSAFPAVYLAVTVGWPILIVWILAMGITFWYSKAKFNYTHELSLGIGVGPIGVLFGMFAVSSSADWAMGIVVSAPFAIVLSFMGLAFDEWPDAEANLKKGVKSMAYKVWECGVSLEWYLMSWILFMFIYQVFLISIGMLAPLTALSFLCFPGLVACITLLKPREPSLTTFRKVGGVLVLIAALYPVLILLGQVFG